MLTRRRLVGRISHRKHPSRKQVRRLASSPGNSISTNNPGPRIPRPDCALMQLHRPPRDQRTQSHPAAIRIRPIEGVPWQSAVIAKLPTGAVKQIACARGPWLKAEPLAEFSFELQDAFAVANLGTGDISIIETRIHVLDVHWYLQAAERVFGDI